MPCLFKPHKGLKNLIVEISHQWLESHLSNQVPGVLLEMEAIIVISP